MRVITNHHDRHYLYGYEVPASVHAEYDYLPDDERMDGWIYYRGSYYHVSDFVITDADDIPGEWNGYHGESFFSGIAIRASDDGETYRIALILV